jgi:hypothetical protein
MIPLSVRTSAGQSIGNSGLTDSSILGFRTLGIAGTLAA